LGENFGPSDLGSEEKTDLPNCALT
jgi:hypothetical protein